MGALFELKVCLYKQVHLEYKIQIQEVSIGQTCFVVVNDLERVGCSQKDMLYPVVHGD